jgi:acyl carrier protein
MKEDEVRREVFAILHRIAPEADLDQIRPDENLREALEIDSFDFLKFILALHDKLGIEIPESDYGEITTLRRMIEYLAMRQP